MAQEVQQNLDYRAELNLIEGVWHQEGKIKEHTQVVPDFWYEGQFVTTNIVGPKSEAWTVYTGVYSIVNQKGATEFKIYNGWVRIPLAWCYKATIKVWGWYSGQSVAHHSIKSDDKVIYSTTTNSAYESGATVVETILNLGKFEVLKYYVYFTFSWTDNVAWGQTRLYLQKL